MREFLKERLNLICLSFLGLLILAGVFAPYIAPYKPDFINLSSKLSAPNATHLLGSDYLGRDVLSRLIYGVRYSLFLPLLAIFLAGTIGGIIGVVAGYFRHAGSVIMRVIDCVLAFPNEFLLLCFIGFLGLGLENILIATIMTKSAWYVRMSYNYTLEFKHLGYVLFARASRLGDWHVITRHIIPNLVPKLVLLCSMDVGAVLLSLSAISFLGLGVEAGTPEWGAMLNEAASLLALAPELCIAPGAMILASALALNLLGDSLNEHFSKH